MEVHLLICGILQIGLAILHIIFPKYFNWKQELASLSLINRQIMYIHTLFIAIAVGLMGILSITEAEALVNTNLGQKICLGFGLFWLIRLFVQFFGYSSRLWKGKPFETVIHIFFSGLWLYLSGLYLIAGLK